MLDQHQEEDQEAPNLVIENDVEGKKKAPIQESSSSSESDRDFYGQCSWIFVSRVDAPCGSVVSPFMSCQIKSGLRVTTSLVGSQWRFPGHGRRFFGAGRHLPPPSFWSLWSWLGSRRQGGCVTDRLRDTWCSRSVCSLDTGRA